MVGAIVGVGGDMRCAVCERCDGWVKPLFIIELNVEGTLEGCRTGLAD